MDPTETLRLARHALQRFLAASDGASADDEHAAASDLAEAFSALDEWLSRGGFLPLQWDERTVTM